MAGSVPALADHVMPTFWRICQETPPYNPAMRPPLPVLAVLLAGCVSAPLPTPPERDASPVPVRTTPPVPAAAVAAPAAAVDAVCTSADTVLRGVVSRVLDGDTADVRLEGDSAPTRIRFYGIDAPEKSQPFGKEARDFLGDALEGETVDVVPTEQRTYGRIVGTVCLGDSSASREMIRRGYAWAYRQYLSRSEADYCELEAEARSASAGLWSQPPWVAPWDWRDNRANPRDYSGETAVDCIAAIGRRSATSTSPPLAPAPRQPGCKIKGNINNKGERIYHVPGSRSYPQTQIDESKGERWFCSVEQAEAAGWRAPR